MDVRWIVMGALAALTLIGCSTGSTSPGPGSSVDDAAGPAASGGVTTVGTTPRAGCASSLRISNTEVDPGLDIADGEIDVETAWADGGPHPANAVDLDGELQLLIADHAVEADPQFGRQVPVGIPDLDDGQVLFIVRLSVEGGTVAAGDTFVEATSDRSATGTITHVSAFVGDDRILLGDTVVTVTAIDDMVVCGTISTAAGTDVQQFVGLDGSFAAARIQALEATEGG